MTAKDADLLKRVDADEAGVSSLKREVLELKQELEHTKIEVSNHHHAAIDPSSKGQLPPGQRRQARGGAPKEATEKTEKTEKTEEAAAAAAAAAAEAEQAPKVEKKKKAKKKKAKKAAAKPKTVAGPDAKYRSVAGKSW